MVKNRLYRHIVGGQRRSGTDRVIVLTASNNLISWRFFSIAYFFRLNQTDLQMWRSAQSDITPQTHPNTGIRRSGPTRLPAVAAWERT